MQSKRFDPRSGLADAPISTRSWEKPSRHVIADMQLGVALDCGWGRLIFGQTYDDQTEIASVLRSEAEGRRDIALYLRDPHVLVARAPDELFIDPSLTYRLPLHRYRPARQPARSVVVRKMRTQADADSTNRIYAANGMVTADPAIMWANQRTRTFTYLVAEDSDSGRVVGTVTGIDHRRAFRDPEKGSSLWCLAVDPQAPQTGVGEALVRTLVERFQARGCAYMDLSVMHDNAGAIALYEKLDFARVPVFCVKRKNPINEPLFTSTNDMGDLNPYARIIAEEAARRGISVRVLDAEWGELELIHGGRHVVTRESLSELTTAVAMSRCDDKRVTRRILSGAGLDVARGQPATGGSEDEAFLADVGTLVVKPARGEQGNGITVGVEDTERLRKAVGQARMFCPDVLLEEYVDGEDLRVVVIDDEVVAAAVRRPATVTGTGRHSIGDLIAKQSRRRAAATGGESSIPVDDHTADVVHDAGYAFDDVLAEGVTLQVRKTANLHTGGTIYDVTADLHPGLAEASVRASRAVGIPVVGLDLLVPAVDGPDYVFVEANERPGLANHEPQPTAQRFIDLLFPHTRPRSSA
jgi:GNAT-family acetyltransferase (TIGR03103 family)